MTTGPVVGPGVGLPGVKSTVPLTSSTPNNPGASSNSVIDSINKRLGVTNIKIDEQLIGSMSYIDSLNDNQLSTIAKILKKQGYTVKGNDRYVKNLLTKDDPTLQSYVTSSKNYDELVAALQQGSLDGFGTGGEKKPNYDSRSIYKYSDEDINAIIKNVYQETVKRVPTQEELDRERAKARPQLEQGTLSTTKLVRNPKTKKMEQVTVQEAGPSKEAVATSISEELKKINPDEADRAARIEFNSWLSKNVEGA